MEARPEVCEQTHDELDPLKIALSCGPSHPVELLLTSMHRLGEDHKTLTCGMNVDIPIVVN
jgi:hypothetical protein